MCRPLEQGSRFRGCASLCAGLAVKESRKFCWKKQLRSRLQHDRGIRHFLLLGYLVFLQRHWGRAALDLSGALAAEREAPRTGRPAAESSSQTAGALASYGSALHKRSRHTRAATIDAAASHMVRPRWLLAHAGNRASSLSVRTIGPAKIAVPAISVSCVSSACRRA